MTRKREGYVECYKPQSFEAMFDEISRWDAFENETERSIDYKS